MMKTAKLKTDDEIIVIRMKNFCETREQAEKFIFSLRAKMAYYLLTMAVKRAYKKLLKFKNDLY